MELDDRLTLLLLQRFDRQPDELAEFDPGLVQHTKARLIDEGLVVSNPAIQHGDDEVKAVFDRHDITPRGARVLMQLQQRLRK